MTTRTRKLVGAVAMIGFITLYVLVMFRIAPVLLDGANKWVELVVYIVFGLIWVLPLLPLIRWMERLSPEEKAARDRARP
jgi:predicted membrane channel-forming protein YqfA (hemolysin III family)